MSKRYWGYMYTTIKRSKYAVVCRCRILGMQIWNFRYANMDFFKTPHIQIWFLGKDKVFKYEFLVLFSHPCEKDKLRKKADTCLWRLENEYNSPQKLLIPQPVIKKGKSPSVKTSTSILPGFCGSSYVYELHHHFSWQYTTEAPRRMW